MTTEKQIMDQFNKWYTSLKRYTGNFPARGTISGALVVLERLKTNFSLDIDDHTAKGGAQIIGASGEALRRILASYGETRPFVSEGGRTNRGLRGGIQSMLDTLRDADMSMDRQSRIFLLDQMQEFLIEKVKEFHNQERIKFVYKPSDSTWQIIHDILRSAIEEKKGGAVAQYLVGAKLQLRFPEMQIENLSYSTADVQLKRSGDFLVGNTVFHVTVSPMPAVYDKCKHNLENGLRPFLLVEDQVVVGTKQNTESVAPGQIIVESIETFISQNIDELSLFSSDKIKNGLKGLIDTYNQRVDQIENDKSLLIEIPPNL